MLFVFETYCSLFRCWWRNVFERWEEHKDHTENVQLITEKQRRMEMWRKISTPAPVSKTVMTRLADLITRKSEAKMAPFQIPGISVDKMFVPLPDQEAQMSNMNTVSPVTQANHMVTSVAHPHQPPAFTDKTSVTPELNVPPLTSHPRTSTPVSTKSVFKSESSMLKPMTNLFSRNNLRRRPLRTYESRVSSMPSFTYTQNGIKDRFMSAFGFSQKSDMPSGIRNDGQNLCFLNCVLQCLSHTPNFVDNLFAAMQQELDCSETESCMVTSLVEILSQCQKTSGSGTLDPSAFRESVATLNGRLVARPTERQHQQDSAEFFMWLMETLRAALNKKPNSGKII